MKFEHNTSEKPDERGNYLNFSTYANIQILRKIPNYENFFYRLEIIKFLNQNEIRIKFINSMKFFFKIVLAVVILPACTSKEDQIQPSIENISESVYASGIVKSKNQYQVFSTVNGLIHEIIVKEGELVKKGDPIIGILNETSKLNTENAQLAADYARLSSNVNKLNELKINIDLNKSKVLNDSLLMVRQQNLWKEHIGARIELEQRELAYKNSYINYQASILKYDDLEKQLRFAEQQSQNNLKISVNLSLDYSIKSEIAGKVYRIYKKLGELVNTQSPLAIIGDANDFILELQIDEYDISRIKTGQKILLSMDSYKGELFEAKVERINPIMDERSRAFTIEAIFVTRPNTLYPNLTSEANIIIQKKENAITIPRNYLIDETFVQMKNKEKRKITTGLKDYEKVEILDGITSSDIIIKPGK